MIQGRRVVVAAIVVCAACVPASAQEGYVGASYLSSSMEFDTSAGTVNPSADGWKLFVGYNINKYCGIEATYYDMGDMEDTTSIGTFKADVDVFDVSFRGILPVGERIQFTGKVGFSSVDAETETTGTLLIVTSEWSSWELMFGVGAEVKLGKRFGLRADWETWEVEGSLDAWSVGGYFRF